MAHAIKRRLYEIADEQGKPPEWVAKGAGSGVSVVTNTEWSLFVATRQYIRITGAEWDSAQCP
jgi:hypothetical protein